MSALDDHPVEPLLSDEGWAYASLASVEAGDPGRFHTLFGRDSLIFALQVLPTHPQVATATLRAHARIQATTTDPETDAEPGKIAHEFWPQAPQHLIDLGWPIRDGAMRYYGTADATSWYLILLAATTRNSNLKQDGENRTLAIELEPNWRAAAAWLERQLTTGDGFIRYGRSPGCTGGLTQQGWRDDDVPEQNPEGGGILRIDGTQPASPLADADCQAAAHAALQALETLDPSNQDHWRDLAKDLRARVSAAFGPDVMAIEPNGDPVPGAGSQLGWLLWSGVLEPDAAARAAQRLQQDDVLTDFGLRTLSADHPGFRADAYHRGGIWPFDSWIGWGGLRAAGQHDAADRVRTGVLAAIEQLGRAPELYAVTTVGALQPIPIANRVQAWSVGAARALITGWDGRTA